MNKLAYELKFENRYGFYMAYVEVYQLYQDTDGVTQKDYDPLFMIRCQSSEVSTDYDKPSSIQPIHPTTDKPRYRQWYGFRTVIDCEPCDAIENGREMAKTVKRARAIIDTYNLEYVYEFDALPVWLDAFERMKIRPIVAVTDDNSPIFGSRWEAISLKEQTVRPA